MKPKDQRIKIVFVICKILCGGTEKALFDLVTLMDKERFDISVFVQQGGGVWEQKFTDAGIRLVFDHSCQKLSHGNPLIKIQNWIKRRKLASALEHDGEGLIDLCFPDGVDIVVSYGVEWRVWTGFAKGAKTVKYIHMDVATNEDYQHVIRRQMPMMDHFDRIICVSSLAADSFKKFTGISKNVRGIFPPFDSDHVREMAETPVDLPRDVPLICAVGRLAPEKGFDRLIRIHKNLLDKGYKHRLVIVGEGRERERIESVIHETETQATVILAGYQSNPYPYVKKSNFLVSSSYTEGLSLVAIESLVLGIPVISAVPSIGEILGDELCGLVTENDDASLEAGIEKVLSNEAFYQQLREGAQRRSAFFDGRRMVQEVENVFFDLVREKRISDNDTH